MATKPEKGLEFVDENAAAEHISKMFTVMHHECHVEKSAEACHRLAEYYRVVDKDLNKAVNLFEDTCLKKNFGESCFALGNMYIAGQGVQKDLKRALELLTKSCDMKIMGACNNAGLVHQANKDMNRAIEMYETSCRGQFANGCFNLSTVYLVGLNGVTQDMKKAFEFSLKSCTLDHSWGCANAGRMYKLGDGVEKNLELAEVYQTKAKDLMMRTGHVP